MPLFAMRMPADQQRLLKDVAKVYGVASGAALVREMTDAICSGDISKVRGFVQGFFVKVGGQMDFLMLTAEKASPVDQVKRSRRKKGGKRRRAH
jgi:hypothetical protein